MTQPSTDADATQIADGLTVEELEEMGVNVESLTEFAKQIAVFTPPGEESDDEGR